MRDTPKVDSNNFQNTAWGATLQVAGGPPSGWRVGDTRGCRVLRFHCEGELFVPYAAPWILPRKSVSSKDSSEKIEKERFQVRPNPLSATAECGYALLTHLSNHASFTAVDRMIQL